MVEEAEFRWHESLGVAPNADQATLRRAMTGSRCSTTPTQAGSPSK